MLKKIASLFGTAAILGAAATAGQNVSFLSPKSLPFGSGSSCCSVVSGDLNGDGKLDLVVGDLQLGFSVLLGSGAGAFVSKSIGAVGLSSPGLGYVVAYPVNESGYNAIVVDTELAEAVEVSWSSNGSPVYYDLFNHGITTSTAGDWYLTYQIFGTPVGASARIQENAAYRAPTGATKQSIIQTASIHPSGGTTTTY